MKAQDFSASRYKALERRGIYLGFIANILFSILSDQKLSIIKTGCPKRWNDFRYYSRFPSNGLAVEPMQNFQF